MICAVAAESGATLIELACFSFNSEHASLIKLIESSQRAIVPHCRWFLGGPVLSPTFFSTNNTIRVY